MNERFKLEITTWTIVKLILIILAFYFLYFIRDIIALLFVVLILVATFSPVVAKWAQSIKRVPAVISILLIFVAFVAAAIYLIIPPFIKETSQFAQNIPDYLVQYSFLKSYAPQVTKYFTSISSGVGGLTQGFVSLTAGIAGGIVAFVTAIVLFVYMLIDEQAYKKLLINIMPEGDKDKIVSVLQKIAQKVGNWFRGQIFLGVIIGVVDFIGLIILGVPYAITLAVVSGLLEIVPTIGPIISAVFAAMIALTVSPLKALLVLIFYILVQQLENNFLVPKIMQKAVGLSPVIIILSILIGAKLLGVMGVILAVPIAASLSVIIKEWPMIKSLLADEK